MDMPDVRSDGVRAADQLALHNARWACDSADLNRAGLTRSWAKRDRRTAVGPTAVLKTVVALGQFWCPNWTPRLSSLDTRTGQASVTMIVTERKGPVWLQMGRGITGPGAVVTPSTGKYCEST